MNPTMATDHPAWQPVRNSEDCATRRDAYYARLVRCGAGAWLATWDAEGVELRCLEGLDARRPVFTRTDVADLPPRTPAGLRAELAAVGSVYRLANPSLWDALTTAVLRQVVRAAQARALYGRWCAAHGSTTVLPIGDLVVVPDPQAVLDLTDEAFAGVGAAFHRTALRAAAAAYLVDGATWEQLLPVDLVTTLCMVPRIGPWTARAAVADFTGKFDVYPHGDLAVRTWAARAALDVAWPTDAGAFEHAWTALADTQHQLHTLTALTLAWGSHARSQTCPDRPAIAVPAP